MSCQTCSVPKLHLLDFSEVPTFNSPRFSHLRFGDAWALLEQWYYWDSSIGQGGCFQREGVSRWCYLERPWFHWFQAFQIFADPKFMHHLASFPEPLGSILALRGVVWVSSKGKPNLIASATTLTIGRMCWNLRFQDVNEMDWMYIKMQTFLLSARCVYVIAGNSGPKRSWHFKVKKIQFEHVLLDLGLWMNPRKKDLRELLREFDLFEQKSIRRKIDPKISSSSEPGTTSIWTTLFFGTAGVFVCVFLQPCFEKIRAFWKLKHPPGRFQGWTPIFLWFRSSQFKMWLSIRFESMFQNSFWSHWCFMLNLHQRWNLRGEGMVCTWGGDFGRGLWFVKSVSKEKKLWWHKVINHIIQQEYSL